MKKLFSTFAHSYPLLVLCAVITLGSFAQTTTHSVALSWTAPTDLVSGDTYVVSRSIRPGLESSSTPLATISAVSPALPATSYVDTSVKAGGTYFYVVYHVRAADGAVSVPSNEFQAVVPLDPPGQVTGLTGVVK
jgi:hypothetical protein